MYVGNVYDIPFTSPPGREHRRHSKCNIVPQAVNVPPTNSNIRPPVKLQPGNIVQEWRT